MSDPTPTLHPAQNRGLRELYATAGQLADHWDALAPRFEAKALADGAARARTLMDELRELVARHNLFVGLAARGAGKSLSGARTQVADRFLERNQALRTAVLDVQHVVTLLGYQAQIAEAHGPADVAIFCNRWERDLAAVERAARRAAVRIGTDPDAAIEPLDSSPAGRAAYGAQYVAGSIGEWFDRFRAGD